MRFRQKRQFNYTARAKIPARAVKLRLIVAKDGPLTVIVDDFGLAQIKGGHGKEEWLKAQVVLEANRHTTSSFARFTAGTVAEVLDRAAPQYSAVLEDFESPGNIMFTVRVVSRDASRLLAEAKNVRAPEEEAQQDELLQVKVHELGQEPWRLAWEEGLGPFIQVNKSILMPDSFLTRDAYLQGVVVPSAFRQVLQRLARDQDMRTQAWAKPWLRFAADYSQTELPTEDEDGQAPDWIEVDAWVNGTLSNYCDKFKFTDKINDLLQSAPENEP